MIECFVETKTEDAEEEEHGLFFLASSPTVQCLFLIFVLFFSTVSEVHMSADEKSILSVSQGTVCLGLFLSQSLSVSV